MVCLLSCNLTDTSFCPPPRRRRRGHSYLGDEGDGGAAALVVAGPVAGHLIDGSGG